MTSSFHMGQLHLASLPTEKKIILIPMATGIDEWKNMLRIIFLRR